jgi:carboxyvinyl-carboxyphosphonate phosphorylmutase
MNSAQRLREILSGDSILLVPGVTDALTARLVQEIGFQATYVTGAGAANVLLGLPDVGLVTMTEQRTIAERVVAAVDIPVIVDTDTGYGNAINVYRTVQEFERAGAAGIQLEDQVTPKRCGHFEGKQVISKAEMVAKLQAATDARKTDLVLIARTDARAVYGLEDALDRARAYCEAGADAIFVEAPQSVTEMEAICNNLPDVPKVANMVEGGKTPLLPLARLQSLGYKIVLYANTAMRAAVPAARQALTHLYKHGDSRAIMQQLLPWEERQRLAGLDVIKAMERKYLQVGEV